MTQFPSTLPETVWLSCRILVALKLDSGPFGNISVRTPDKQHFWINPTGITFDQLHISDIVRVDLNGNVVEGRHAAHPGEFIHREIYRLREDVEAIVHTHSENTVALSLLGCTIEPYTQLGAAIHNDQGIYHGFTGPVRDSNEGAAIASSLGNHAIVIAKNHGMFTVHNNLPAALWDFVIADQAAKIHLNALQFGLTKAEPLPAASLKKSQVEVRERQYLFMWHNYVNKISARNNDVNAFAAKEYEIAYDAHT